MNFEWSYSTVSNVLDSWERIRRIEDYEQVVGVQLFQKFLTLQPKAKLVLGFPNDLDTTASLQNIEETPKDLDITRLQTIEETPKDLDITSLQNVEETPKDSDFISLQTMEENPKFAQKSTYFVKFFLQMISTVVDMLGPDMDTFEDILLDLGQRNVRYGVQPEFYVSIGQALMEVLSENLTPAEFSPKVKADWVEVYAGVSHIMIVGHNQSLKRAL